MKVSVIMVDGSFRENIFGAEYFTKQDFPKNEFEVIWVEFYKKANPNLYKIKDLKIISLGNKENTVYHSSYCFNEGIKQAKGELLIIPDADVIVEPDFVKKAWEIHQAFEKLVVYGYRYNEVDDAPLENHKFSELKKKCLITNPINYGGCLTVRKKWMLEINGYDQTEIFSTGFHANGKDIYTRFRNYGMAIQWESALKLYHPKHTFTAEKAPEYSRQRELIAWRSNNLEYLPLDGIDPAKNTTSVFKVKNPPVNAARKRLNLFQRIKPKIAL